MSVESYTISLLSLDACPVQMTPDRLLVLLRAWRKHRSFAGACSVCQTTVRGNYTVCCQQFYYNSHLESYPVQSIAIPTPGYVFALPVLARWLKRPDEQEFVVIPDPIYWQLDTTLEYEKLVKFVQGIPISKRTRDVHPPSKSSVFYKKILEAPLNYGSLQRRSCGKSTFIRQVAFGRRCTLSMRGMIVPDASLPPNEIRLPEKIILDFHLRGKWIILNRMPSLQPGNFVGLRVADPGWNYDCFGIPLEIVQAMNADFDGDECNLYLIPNALSQAECATLLNSESNMGCFVMQGPKLTPSQDMLVAYYLRYDEVDFLPYKTRDLHETFRVLFDMEGSENAFRYVDRMRRFYLKVLQDDVCFALTLEEMMALREGKEGGCLTTQVRSGAKGSMEHLHQMFREVGFQSNVHCRHSFWDGLSPVEAVAHAKTTIGALGKLCKIWEPGYGYSKMVYNLQGLHVDYGGRLMDGDAVVECDALDALHYTDVMSTAGFEHLVRQWFPPED